jgi:hypothetical protein
MKQQHQAPGCGSNPNQSCNARAREAHSIAPIAGNVTR